MISTKGRYALRVMIDLAEHNTGERTPMKEIAERQEISLKYLERILPPLSKKGLIESLHGKGGGIRLTKKPEAYTAWDILSVVEDDLAPVACLGVNAPFCHRTSECRTLPIWKKYYELTENYFKSITLADLLKNESTGDFVI